MKNLLKLTAVIMAILCLSAIGLTATPTRINLVISDERSIDPSLCWSAEDFVIVYNLFVPLVEFDYAKMKPVPALAKSWDVSADGLVWTFHLRTDVKWTDGNPVVAEDVEYAFKRIIDPKVASQQAGQLFLIKNAKDVNTGKADLSALGVKAIDKQTVQITLEHPAGYFASLITQNGFAVPKQAIDKYGDKWTEAANIVTNGPYKLTKWTHQNEYVLEKNPNYYDAKHVTIQEVHYYYILEDSTAMSMYQAGQLDSVNVPAADIDRVKSDPVLSKQFHNGPLLITLEVPFNTEKPPFDNVLVRKAFTAAIDREALVKYIMKGGQQPAYTFTPPGCLGSVPASAGMGIRFNVEQARKYLAQAGYPGGKGLPEITYVFNTSEANQNVAQALQQMWKDNLGVNVKIAAQESKTYWDLIVSGSFQFWRMGFNAYYPDANAFVYDAFHSKYGENTIRWHNADYDRLTEQAGIESNPTKRAALYRQAEKILCQDQCVIIPLWYYAYNIVTKPNLVRDYNPSLLNNIKNWKLE